MKTIRASKVFDLFNILIMIIIILVTAYPVYYVVAVSISNPPSFAQHRGFLLAPLTPLSTKAYELVFKMPQILSGYRNTLFILVFGILTNMVMTTLGAYFLSIKGPMHRNLVAFMVIFTMYFSGGMIPSYFNIRSLGLLNSLWALILPSAIAPTNMIILRTAFQGIPDSLTEAAKLDGANCIQILVKIFLPLSKATLAVLALYYAVGHWNSWFSASIYLTDSNKFPVQLVMRNLLNLSATSIDDADIAEFIDQIKYALIVVTTAPIMFVYPFLQKYFTKGVMIGALKG